ncbi:hypothetical protein [Pseudoflavitalea rhizosphaerae]|uniref:hypothetical protein n=1 Tax=Pseudoflavitalea rhizosphaerae TaxID=1884793 RepID=UPI000F8CA390|nr:hypothetical protein [Pseudoflavitalea rhizosphaerae]
MKSVQILLLFLTTTLTATAQGVFSNQTNAALQRVIEDYPNRFKNIKGDLLQESGNAADYQSKVQIPGSLHCVISLASQPAPLSNWTCSIFLSTDYDKARQKYQELYDQISNTIIRIKGQKPFILNGSYTTPEQESKSTATRFQMTPAPECVQNLKIEINLRFKEEWEVVLSVYE